MVAAHQSTTRLLAGELFSLESRNGPCQMASHEVARASTSLRRRAFETITCFEDILYWIMTLLDIHLAPAERIVYVEEFEHPLLCSLSSQQVAEEFRGEDAILATFIEEQNLASFTKDFQDLSEH